MPAGGPVPLHGRKARRQATFTSPSGGGRTPPAPAKTGARRRVVGTAEKPVQETTAIRVRTPVCFDAGGNTVTRRVTVATVHQHGAAVPELNQAPEDSNHGLENARGRTISGSGSARQGGQNLLISAALKTVPPDDESKSNLRVKRSDPSFRANVPPQAVAVPGRNGADAEPIIRRRVWTQLGERAAGRRPPNPAERPHSIIPHG